MEEGNYFLPASLSLACKFIYSAVMTFFTNTKLISSGFQCILNANYSAGVFLALSTRLELLRHTDWCTEQPWDYQSFLYGTANVGIPRPHPVMQQSNLISPI